MTEAQKRRAHILRACGHSYAEIGRILECDEQAVRREINREAFNAYHREYKRRNFGREAQG